MRHCTFSKAIGSCLIGIRNPIGLARLILDHSTLALSLRRVPPNLLVGEGATNYADEHQIKVYHPDLLISPSAGERFTKWKGELEKAGPHGEDEDLYTRRTSSHRTSTMAGQPDAHDLDVAPCWNESQPDSPSLNFGKPSSFADKGDSTTSPPASRKRKHGSSSEFHTDGQGSDVGSSGEEVDSDLSPGWEPQPLSQSIRSSQEEADFLMRKVLHKAPGNSDEPQIPMKDSRAQQISDTGEGSANDLNLKDLRDLLRDDDIMDTVGAIAVDCFGNIAAGSSSGGIGMKHKGRVGPAALVGIGTAVVPIEPDDDERLCVASVTSGTGEHMATSMAAATCAKRLYTSTCHGKRGSSESTDDDSAMRSFVEHDFMRESAAPWARD